MKNLYNSRFVKAWRDRITLTRELILTRVTHITIIILILIVIMVRFLPLAEVIMCSGFFFICALEELLHHFLHPHQVSSKTSGQNCQYQYQDQYSQYRHIGKSGEVGTK